jgi:methyl-accepting chemotaxis protein PixJ
MSSNQTQIPATASQQDRSTNPFQHIKNLVRRNLVGTITITVAGSLLLTGVSTWNIWSIYNSFQSTVAKQFELQKNSADLTYQDEALTMTVKMLASTGDLKWDARYAKFAAQADVTLKKFTTDIPTHLRAETSKTDASSGILLGLEDKAIKLVRAGKKTEAFQILTGNEYETQKVIFTEANNAILAKVDRLIQAELNNYKQQLLVSIVFAAATLPILLASWSLVLAAVRDYIRDRQTAQQDIERSQSDLRQLNEQLAGEVNIRGQQEQQIRTESELLQSDVGHILDVVCSIEAGDLTVQAEVNERATGLVADTLNRLIESLDRIVSAVVDTAQQVTNDAGQLELAAVDTARQAQVQANEVRSVQSLMDNINVLTADSRQQAIDTAVAVQQAKAAVVSGKQAIDDTTEGIETLQQGTIQIIKRSELLTEFIDLAAQFSKDRKRVAALTRVLALNVSTLSSRAIKERDPDRFASLAREFETIALQVNDLAMDTNHSLLSLQQRTDSVQTVTSGLTQDIGEIDRLVQKFTTEIDKSRQAFDNIQTVTEEVSQMSKKVNVSSQDIVKVVSDTLSAISSISNVAQTTEAKASITREQVQSMGNLANKLLQMVEFFKLNESQLAATSLPAQATRSAPHQLVQV